MFNVIKQVWPMVSTWVPKSSRTSHITSGIYYKVLCQYKHQLGCVNTLHSRATNWGTTKVFRNPPQYGFSVWFHCCKAPVLTVQRGSSRSFNKGQFYNFLRNLSFCNPQVTPPPPNLRPLLFHIYNLSDFMKIRTRYICLKQFMVYPSSDGSPSIIIYYFRKK